MNASQIRAKTTQHASMTSTDTFVNVIRDSDVGRDFLFQQLGSLINVVQQHIRNYLDNIFDLIKGDLLFFRGSADYAITNGEYRYRKGLNLWDS